MDLIVHRSPRLAGRIAIRGSKNYTSRYVLAASLAEGESLVKNPAPIDDAAVMIRCCRALGARIEEVDGGLLIHGTGGRLRSPGRLDVGNAGAVTRFLIGVCAIIAEPTTFVTPYPESLGKRPHGDLLDALAQLGAQVQSDTGRLPVTVARGQLRGGPVRISGSTSSQFTTALLFLAPLLDGETVIEVEGELVSQPALEQTLAVLGDAGIEITAAADRRRYLIPGGQRYRSGEYRVPGDWPAASAILAAAACTDSDVTAEGLLDDAQGERASVDVLAEMGARVAFDPAARTVRVQSAPLQAVDFDGDPATDAVLALAAAMCFARGTSTIYNVENLRYKECDRITDYLSELRKIGVVCEEGRDRLILHGRPGELAGGAVIDAHHDHRVLMGCTIVALAAKQPVRLSGAEHIAKSYPQFFDDLRSLGARIEPG